MSDGTPVATPTAPKRARRRPGRGWLIGAAAAAIGALILGAGAGGWFLANATLVASHDDGAPAPQPAVEAVMSELQMPDVRGLDLATAQQVLADSGIPVDAISTHDAPSVATAGIVVEQTPAFGASTVTTVELGLAVAVTMPDVAGRTQQEAIATLSGFGAGVEVTFAYAKDAKPGQVLASTPAAGEPLGQSATIVVATAGSTLPLSEVRSLRGRCGSDTNVAIAGVDHATALVCSTRTDQAEETTWVLSRTVDRFVGTVGIADSGAPGSAVPYEVVLDGIVVAQGTATYGTAVPLDIPLTGVIQLTIRVGAASAKDVQVVFGDAVVYGSDEGIARLGKR